MNSLVGHTSLQKTAKHHAKLNSFTDFTDSLAERWLIHLMVSRKGQYYVRNESWNVEEISKVLRVIINNLHQWGGPLLFLCSPIRMFFETVKWSAWSTSSSLALAVFRAYPHRCHLFGPEGFLAMCRKPVPLFSMTPLEWHELIPESSDKDASRNILTIIPAQLSSRSADSWTAT